MAKGLDELIEHLLGEIALTGNQGVTINEIAAYTSSFYKDDHTQDPSATGHPSSPSTRPSTVPLDSRLLSKIWTWLGRHPDVSIGDDRQYNKTPLAEVELQFPGYVDTSLKGNHPSVLDSDSDSSRGGVPTSNPRRKSRRDRGSNGPRIRLNDERIYRAICGHPPDIRKVVPLEFNLLSHIAAARSSGLLQGELVRLSGQDKRSVPKRTDALHKKGYIVKEIVYQKGNRTSRLTLSKFTTSHDRHLQDHDKPSQHGSSVRDVVRRIFDVLADKILVPQTTLAEKLSLESPAGLCVLTRIIRRLERLHCVKRVRMAVGPSATSNDLKNFIQLLHPAQPENLQNFDTDSLSLDQFVEELVALVEQESQNDTVAISAAENDEEDPTTVRDTPKWNPDRLMPNSLLDAVHLAGANGLTHLDARHMITGVFVRRTMEALLGRISGQSLVVQPPHLRHLAIIRTALTVDGVAQYLHYSWEAFRQKVEQHEMEFIHIPGARQALDAVKPADDELGQPSVKVDQFGFPLESTPILQLRNGEVGLPELITAAHPGDVLPRHGEVVVVKEGDRFFLKRREDRPRSTNEVASRQIRRPQPTKQERPKDSQEVAKGRPRKYLRGTEKFWRQQFKYAKHETTGMPLTAGSKGIMDDPSGLALYARRPAHFDETLVEALNAGLPIPTLPQDITDAWVRSTMAVLNRGSAGIYVTFHGCRSDNVRQSSQIVIIKTSRLNLVDFSDRTKTFSFRFISSSASHSFAYRRYYPILSAAQSISHQSPVKSNKPRAARGHGRSGPPKGIFYEDLTLSKPPSLPTIPDIDIPLDELMDTTDEESGIPQPSRLSRSVSTISQQARHGDDNVDLAPNLLTLTSVSKSARERKPTQKAVDLIDSTQGRNFRLFSQARSMSVGPVTSGPDSEHEQPSESQPEPLGQQTVALRPDPEVQESITPQQDPLPSIPSPADFHGAEIQDRSHQSVPVVDSADGALAPSPVMDPQTLGNKLDDVPASTPTLPVPVEQPQQTADNIAAEGEDPAEVLTPTRSRSRKNEAPVKRRRTATPDGSDDEFQQRERRVEGRQSYRHGANATCRRIILQLVGETLGVVPNDPFTLKRISTPRWQEAGQDDRPLLKTMKAAIKTLCEQGQLKQVTFAFRGKSGIMLRRSVIFLKNISSRSQLVEDVKQKIIDAEPLDYIPPEWSGEGSRIPLVNRRALNGTPEVETPPRRARRVSSATADSEDTPRTTRSTRSPTRTSIPSPPPTFYAPATGFLSLKIPSLGSLHAVQLHDWRIQCPVKALLSDTGLLNPWRSASYLPTRPGRVSRKPRQANRSIVWATEKALNFPSSLSNILQVPDLELDYAEFLSDDLDWQRFACEIEGVRSWEEQRPDAFSSTRTKYAFINHSVPPVLFKDATYPVTSEFAKLVQFDQSSSEMEVDYPPAESWPVFSSALETSPEEASQIAGVVIEPEDAPQPPIQKSTGRRSTRAPKRKAKDEDSAFESTPKRRKRVVGGAPRRTARPKTTRTPRYLQTLPGEMIYRIAISVVVVRTLAGGIESFIDWPLVMSVFPGEKEAFIKDRWKTLYNRHHADIRGLTENLQWRYLQALEAGEVPSVNFQDVKATDWRGIVEWAMKHLDKFNAKQIEDLPESREKFVDNYNVEFGEPRHYYSLLGYNSTITGNTRDDIASSVVFGVSHRDVKGPKGMPASSTILEYAPRHEIEAADSDVRLARSWVLATVLTLEATFNPSVAKAKLSTLAPDSSTCEALLSRAARLLQDEKLIQRLAKERPSDGLSSMRTFEGNRKLFERFERRMINANMLRQAIGYKLDVLDEAFDRNQTVMFDRDGIVQDGDMVAVLNLMSMGQLRPKPGGDEPRTRYGLDWERVGYRSKNMDKKLLGFSVEVIPTERYVRGDPRFEARSIPIPRGEADAPRGLIPPWIDIHGTVQMPLWEMFLVGALGLVVQMPGVSALEISRAIGGALDQEAVKMVLEWCVQGGFAKMDVRSHGYETTEWWWLCISR